MSYEFRFWPVLIVNPIHIFTGSVRPVLNCSGSDQFGSTVPKRFRKHHDTFRNNDSQSKFTHSRNVTVIYFHMPTTFATFCSLHDDVNTGDDHFICNYI